MIPFSADTHLNSNGRTVVLGLARMGFTSLHPLRSEKGDNQLSNMAEVAHYESVTPELLRQAIYEKRSLEHVWLLYAQLIGESPSREARIDEFYEVSAYFAQNPDGEMHLLTILKDIKEHYKEANSRVWLLLMSVLMRNERYVQAEQILRTLEKEVIQKEIGWLSLEPYRLLILEYGKKLILEYGKDEASWQRMFNVYERLVQVCGEPDDGLIQNMKDIWAEYRKADILRDWWKNMSQLPDADIRERLLNPSLLKELLLFFSRQRNAKYALEVNEFMLQQNIPRDVKIFTSLLHTVGRTGDLKHAIQIYNEMLGDGIKPTLITYQALIDIHLHASPVPQLQEACRFYDLLVADGLQPDVILYGSLLELFSKRGDLEITQRLYRDIIENGIRPNEYIFSSLIKCFINNNDIPSAIEIFRQIPLEGVDPDQLVYNLLIRTYRNDEHTDAAWRIFDSMLRAGLKPNVINFATLLAMYARKGDVGGSHAVARTLVEAGLQPNLFIYAGLMHAYAMAMNPEGCEKIFLQLEASKQFQLNTVVYNTLINAYVRTDNLESALKLHNRMVEANIALDHYTYCILMNAFALKGDLRSAEEIFQTMSADGLEPNTECYNVLIHGFLLNEKYTKAHELIFMMREKGMVPDFITYAVLVNGWCQKQQLDMAQKIVDMVREESLTHTETDWEGYIANIPTMEDWRQAEGAPLKNKLIQIVLSHYSLGTTPYVPVVIYTPLLSAYSRLGRFDDVKILFSSMCSAGTRPTNVAWIILLDTLRQEGNIDAVLKLWQMMGGSLPNNDSKVKEESSNRKASSSSPDNDILILPNEPLLQNIPKPDFLGPIHTNSRPPPRFGLSIVMETLIFNNRAADAVKIYMDLQAKGFTFDIHNWNVYVQALITTGDVMRACEVMKRLLLADNPRSWSPEDKNDYVGPDWEGYPNAWKEYMRVSANYEKFVPLIGRKRDSLWIRMAESVKPYFPFTRTFIALSEAFSGLRQGQSVYDTMTFTNVTPGVSLWLKDSNVGHENNDPLSQRNQDEQPHWSEQAQQRQLRQQQPPQSPFNKDFYANLPELMREQLWADINERFPVLVELINAGKVQIERREEGGSRDSWLKHGGMYWKWVWIDKEKGREVGLGVFSGWGGSRK